MAQILIESDALDSLKRMVEELERDAARWRKARDYLSIEDIESWSTEMRWHQPDEEESIKADKAIDAAMKNE